MHGVIVVGGFQGLAMPAVSALMSHQVEADAQGELQGAVASLQALGSVAGPPLMTGVFALCTNGRFPVQFVGMPFLLSAALILLAVLLLPRRGSSHP